MKPRLVSLLLIVFVLIVSVAATADLSGDMVSAHNAVRTPLKLPPVAWDPALATTAQTWADHLAKNGCKLEHRPRTGEHATKYGENLFWGSAAIYSTGEHKQREISPKHVVDSWAAEVADYDYETGACTKVCGHYTQVVWRTTARIGCGMAVCADKAQLWVCNYDPPGNYRGKKPY